MQPNLVLHVVLFVGVCFGLTTCCLLSSRQLANLSHSAVFHCRRMSIVAVSISTSPLKLAFSFDNNISQLNQLTSTFVHSFSCEVDCLVTDCCCCCNNFLCLLYVCPSKLLLLPRLITIIINFDIEFCVPFIGESRTFHSQQSAMDLLSQNVRDLVSQDYSQMNLDFAGHYLLIDIGANLTNRKYAKDLDSVLQRAKDAGVCKIIVTGTSIASSKDALRLSCLHPDILYCTAGVHPHDAKQWTEESEALLIDIASNAECVAIGECGLDYNRDFSPRDIQQEVFEKQVKIACDLKLKGINRPLFLHERDAHEDFVKILDRYQGKLPSVVVHCFTGTQEEALKYLDMGFFIGLTGYVSKLNSENGVIQLFEEKKLPLDRLMLETDSPYCYPNTRSAKLTQKVKDALSDKSLSLLHRYSSFQRNEPSSLPITLEMVAAYLEMKPEDVALKTTFNALKFFGISC